MQLLINENQKELKSHGDYSFSVAVSEEVLSNYERGIFLWHWHPEIELTFVIDGEIIYQVNNQVYHLKEGDGLFCNSNALHTGHMINDKNCHYISITFHPRIVYGYEGSSIYQNYVKPVTDSDFLGSFCFHEDIVWQKSILNEMKEIYGLYFSQEDFYDFKIQQKLSTIWLTFYANYIHTQCDALESTGTSRDVERLRKILSFLDTNYAKKITLEDISKEVGLCKGECCRFFKRMMDKSLFDYILYYRIEKSLPLLAQKNLSVTDIAEQTGFSSSSYYARVFKEQFQCSPREYRRVL